MSGKKACRQETLVRQIAEQKLSGTGYVLRQGRIWRDLEGWRVPVRKLDEPDSSADNEPMIVTVLVAVNEING